MTINQMTELKKYVSNRKLYCRVLKALYGSIQEGKLWYDHISEVLQALEYEASLTDPCALQRVVIEDTYMLILYVDDILIISSDGEIEWVSGSICGEIMDITMSVGAKQSYLHMNMEMKPG